MTTRGTHTPGPWTVHMPGAFTEVQAGQKVAIVGWQGFDDSDRPLSEHRANAHLIAAAYDYHEAMTECLKPDHGYNIEYVSIPLKVWQRFLAAHAKAEGSTPTSGEQG